jgi:predicted transposase YdaD
MAKVAPLSDSEASWFQGIAAHPHDAYFKWVFSHEKWAARFFQAFLPAWMVEALDWSTLRLEFASSADSAAVTPLYMDLLFSVVWKAGRKPAHVPELARLRLLFEHQSRIDPAMPLRLVRYSTVVMRQGERSAGFPVPTVVPVLLHQGTTPWTAPERMIDLVAVPEEYREQMMQYVPSVAYHLVDLANLDLPMPEDGELRLVLESMREVSRDAVRALLEWISRNAKPDWDNELLSASVSYALRTGGDLDAKEALGILQKSPHLKSTMSIADKIFALGAEEGEARGVEKGVKKGVKDGMKLGIEKGIEKGMKKGIEKGVQMGQLIGKVHLYEELIGLTPSPAELLRKETEKALRKRIAELEARFRKR